MSEKSSINVDLDDPRIGKIADVISNKTCKRILSEISEVGTEGLSESEISSKLNIPANTVNYNIKKLEESGLIVRIKGVLWSEKGKRIYKYKVSNRKIVISPKSIHRAGGLIASVLITAGVALGIKVLGIGAGSVQNLQDTAEGSVLTVEKSFGVASSNSAGIVAERAGEAVSVAANIYEPQIWAWFLLGAWIALIIITGWAFFSDRKNERRSF